jgi:hypothetical protein
MHKFNFEGNFLEPAAHKWLRTVLYRLYKHCWILENDREVILYDRRILSQLIALTKEIRLIEPQNIQSCEAQFFAGHESPFIFRGGIVITWWYTDKAFKLRNNIASMSIEKYAQLTDGDKDKLSEVIEKAFCVICLNADFFNGDDVFLRRKQNLFEARAIDDVDAFSKKLWDFILA